MKAFEQYIRDAYQQDIFELKKAENLIRESSNTLVEIFEKSNYWPYEIKKNKIMKKDSLTTDHCSTSTTAMIFLSLEKIGNLKAQNNFKITSGVNENIIKTKKEALRQILSTFRSRKVKTKSKEEDSFQSSTYGINDVFTLSWISEILRLSNDEQLTTGDNFSHKFAKILANKLDLVTDIRSWKSDIQNLSKRKRNTPTHRKEFLKLLDKNFDLMKNSNYSKYLCEHKAFTK